MFETGVVLFWVIVMESVTVNSNLRHIVFPSKARFEPIMMLTLTHKCCGQLFINLSQKRILPHLLYCWPLDCLYWSTSIARWLENHLVPFYSLGNDM